MDFDLSEDQRLLKDSVDRLMADIYGFEQRQTVLKSTEGWSQENWRKFAELGLLGVNFAERHNGFGGGAVETMLIAEAFGRALVVEPYLATVILSGGLLRHCANTALQDDYLPRIACGEVTMAFAHHERQARYNLSSVATSAVKSGDEWEINGEKSLVLHGDSADKIIVSARICGGVSDHDDIGLFLVDAAGLQRRGYPTQDGQRAAELSFSATRAEAMLSLNAFDIISKVVDEASAFLCAEAVGAMDDMHATTVDYMKTRKQFGRAIGEFQVLQHRAVDMFVELEQSRSMALYATMMAGEENASERGRAISAARVQIGSSSRKLSQEAIQLHGGIAMTMEYKVGHYFKRLAMIEKQFGDTESHRARLVADGTAF
jgi:pimeloyl-CoA dehydrogenase small subunit